jgi:hypothetical protein
MLLCEKETYDRDMSNLEILPFIRKKRVKKFNRYRELHRNAFNSVKTLDNNVLPNVLLKTHFFTITSQITDYQIYSFKKDIRLINQRLNQRLIHRRKYKKSPNRIVFYCYFEKSNNKLLTHVHFLLRVPIKYIYQTDKIASVIRKSLPNKYCEKTESFHKFQLEVREEEYSIQYSTKHYSDYNDNFDVY